MSLRINDLAPDFTAQTTLGTIKFHEWIGDSELAVAKLYSMLPAEVPGTSEGGTAATARRRCSRTAGTRRSPTSASPCSRAETGRVVPARRQPRALRNVIRIEVRLGGKARPTDVAWFSPYRIPCRTALAPGRPVMPAVPPWRRCPTTTKQCMRHAQGCTAVGHASGTVEDPSAGGISGNDGSTSASANSRVAPLVMTRRPPCRQLGVGGSLAILSKV